MSTFILTGPAASGKTQLAQQIVEQLGFQQIIEEWNPSKELIDGALHITNSPVELIRDKFPETTILEIK